MAIINAGQVSQFVEDAMKGFIDQIIAEEADKAASIVRQRIIRQATAMRFNIAALATRKMQGPVEVNITINLSEPNEGHPDAH